jgi:hypothetical protein
VERLGRGAAGVEPAGPLELAEGLRRRHPPIFGWAEAQSGVSWLEPGLRYAVGRIAAVIALLILVPRTRLIGAWSAFALSLAFIVAHLTPWLGVNIPAYTPLMEALAAGRTAEEIAAMGLKTDKGAHFTLAMINLGLAFVTIGAEKALRKPKPRTLVQTLASRDFAPA